MRNWTIGKRLTAGFSAVVGFTTILAMFSFMRLSTIHEATELVTKDSLPGVYYSGRAQALAKDGYGNVLRHVLAEPAEQSTIEEGLRKIGQDIDRVFSEYQKTIRQDRDRDLFGAIDSPKGEFRRIRDQVVLPLSRQGKRNEATAAVRNDLAPVFAKYMAAIDACADFNKEFGDSNAARVDSVVTSTQWTIALGLRVTILLGAGSRSTLREAQARY